MKNKRLFLPSNFRGRFLGLLIYTVIFLVFSHRVYFNITLYNHYGVGKVNNISQSAMSEGTGSRTHYELKTNNNKRVVITYMDNGESSLGLEMGDTIIFRYVGGVNVQALKRNGVEIGSYFQFWDYFSFIMTIILGLGYYYIPRFYKRNENEENKKLLIGSFKKTKKIWMISIVIFLNLQNSTGQGFMMKEKTNFSLPVKENLMDYTIYPSNSIIEGIYKNVKESKNMFPEEVLISILSATDYEWDKSNYDYLINNNVQKYKLMTFPSQKPQIVLNRKLKFEVNDSEYAIIKYSVVEDGEIKPSSFTLINKLGKWFITNEINLSRIDLMFNYLNIKSLDAIFLNRRTGITSFDEQIIKCYNNGILNLNKYVLSTPEKEMTEEEIKKIIEPL